MISNDDNDMRHKAWGCLAGTPESVISLGLGWMHVWITLLMIKFRLLVVIFLSLLFYSNITCKLQLMLEFHKFFLDHVGCMCGLLC